MHEGKVFWSDILEDFDGEEDVTSLWDKRFLVKGLVREKLLTHDDFNRIDNLELV